MRWIGRAVLGVAAVHTLFGAAVFRGTVSAMAREGFVATITDQADRGAVFWFFYTGFALAILGGWMHECEAEERRFPTYLVAGLAALTGAGLLIMPASGFWLLIPPVGGAIVRNRRMSVTVRR
ncbi:MAG: DUF6463 family protein [Anaeromyxobacteraceae bacterium]